MTAVPVATRDDRLDPQLLRTGFVLILGAVMALLDTTIVNVGIDVVVTDLDSPLQTVQWVSTGYLLAVSMVMPLAGWASERFGGRTTWLASVGLFVGGSVLCGLAWSAPALIAFRVLQGIGGGLVQPVGQALFARAAGPSRLCRAIPVVVLPATFAPVLGPILGGALVHSLDWRWMFFINLPIGIVTLVLAARVVPEDEHVTTNNRLDVRGLVLLSPGLALVVYGFTTAAEDGGFGSVATALTLGAGGVLLVAYGVHALRGRNTPLIDLRLFARRGFAVATGSSFLLGASLYSSMLLLPLYYQQVEHADALQAGLLLAPQALGTAAATIAVGLLADRFSPRATMLAGIGLALLGTIAFTQLGAHPSGWLLAISLLVRGFGLGATMAPNMAAVYASVEPNQVARAAGALNTINRVGGSLGTAVLVVALPNASAGATAPAEAFGNTFWLALLLSALSLVPAVLFPKSAK